MNNLIHRSSGSNGSDCEFIGEQITPDEIAKKLAVQETFVVNIVALWCPDCTAKQVVNLQMFSDLLAKADIKLYQCTVQEERGVFVSEDHEDFTHKCGGHGYPRTVLISKGQISDSDNVEVVSLVGLTDLANRFIAKR